MSRKKVVLFLLRCFLCQQLSFTHTHLSFFSIILLVFPWNIVNEFCFFRTLKLPQKFLVDLIKNNCDFASYLSNARVCGNSKKILRSNPLLDIFFNLAFKYGLPFLFRIRKLRKRPKYLIVRKKQCLRQEKKRRVLNLAQKKNCLARIFYLLKLLQYIERIC